MIDVMDLLPPTALSRRLDEALERMEAGDDVVKAAGLNWSMASLQSLLQAAAVMHDVPKAVADAPAKARVRNAFMAEAAGQRIAWVHSHSTPLTKKRKVPRTGHPFGNLVALAALLVVAIVVGSIAAVAAGFSDPDSPLYPLKELGEGTLSALTFNPVSNASLKVTFAQQRLREAEAMASRNEPQLVLQCMRSRYQDLREAAQELAGVSNRDAGWIAARNALVSEEDNAPVEVITQLQQEGDGSAAQQVQALTASYAAERKVLDAQLAVAGSAPKSTSSATTTASGTAP